MFRPFARGFIRPMYLLPTRHARVFLPQMTRVSITEPGSYYVKYFYLTLKWSKILRGNQSDKSSLPRLSLQILFMYFSVWNMKIFSLFKNHLQWALLTLLVCLHRERLYWSEFCWSLQNATHLPPKPLSLLGLEMKHAERPSYWGMCWYLFDRLGIIV